MDEFADLNKESFFESIEVTIDSRRSLGSTIKKPTKARLDKKSSTPQSLVQMLSLDQFLQESLSPPTDDTCGKLLFRKFRILKLPAAHLFAACRGWAPQYFSQLFPPGASTTQRRALLVLGQLSELPVVSLLVALTSLLSDVFSRE